MRYLKTYESSSLIRFKSFWIINTEMPYFEFSMKKIGMSDEQCQQYKKWFVRPEDIIIWQKKSDDWGWSTNLSLLKEIKKSEAWKGRPDISEETEQYKVGLEGEKYNL